MTPAGRAVRVAPLVLAGLVAAAPGRAQTGFTADGARHQAELESRLLASIRPAAIERTVRALASRPHVAGSPGQAAVRDSLVAWLAEAGLEPEVRTYEVFLPWPERVRVGLTAPETLAFDLGEPPVPADPVTAAEPYPWVNGYAAPGRAEAEVVYANYGLHDDYDRLDSLGVEVAGKVVVARYGRSFRGIKAQLAGERDAAALVLYSDPADDGYVQGDVYPEGGWRPWNGVQRGSVMTGRGDPTTPAGPSVAGAERTPPGPEAGLPSLPVVPVSYRIAGEILGRLGGADVPDQEWQGGLPFRYHVGPGPARLEVVVDDDRDGPERGFKPIHDVIAVIEGSQWPDRLVIVGGHIDAWGPGANDNVSGTASVLEAARATAALVRTGERPRRTIVFAGWDAEEWGLIGSVEWVEENAERLAAGGVGYINQDAIGGTRFRASASPGLKGPLREAARAIPAASGTLYETWAEQSPDPAGIDSVPPMGNLGGGSDYAGFYNHLGIPSANHGFGAPEGAGVYHSAYDTPRWMATFGDPGFDNHARSSSLAAVLALRLANAEVLPYDYAEFAREMKVHWRALRELAEAQGTLSKGTGDGLDRAWAELERQGERLARARTTYLAGPVDPATSRRANDALIAVERALTRPEGLEGRPWVRNLVFAADPRNGYATLALPSVADAFRAGETGRARREVDDLADRVRRAAVRVGDAADILKR